MKRLFISLALSVSLFANDLIIKESKCNVDETVTYLKHILRNRRVHIFDTIDHHYNAKLVDMKLDESVLLIFGNPEVGTALMQQDITIGLELPLKVLIYSDHGKVKLAYRDSEWLKKKHILEPTKKIAKINTFLDEITTEAGSCTED